MYYVSIIAKTFVKLIGDLTENPAQKNLNPQKHFHEAISLVSTVTRNAKERKSLPLQVINFNVAGIDVGSRSHLVAVDQNQDNVRTFGIYTIDHEQLIQHL
ncbi:hypothetical protein [Dyadobacter koreensis]|uniref:hypothetical protein n=1 Tax=Dyadobacter koreensis TaxID=408657 RepID=UPI000B896637|nr:hypothetical protein [Dyadobacter koreensis]